ncbi:TonB-dependent receptor [Sphingomonas sp. HF-S4]|uniref:TonB-dependent receptor n=1 Tax=Sphingomonas agrestis TaxID=3080540 RepID=A0ABU3Y3X6_9SPHN|nr:TonB-dependent receptor [Sphingomonas sp. HF-S4]MDV3456050.1 TonB-dependent receptor [Sphingomonas sp. HF-S4]
MRAAVLLCALSCPSIASAQQGMVLRVTGADDLPIDAAEILLVAPVPGEAPIALLSDGDGRASIDQALIERWGTVNARISAIGYRDASVRIDPASPRDQVVRLEPVREEGSIVVIARRVSRPFSPHMLSLLDIVTDARANADPVLAANDLPSSTNAAPNATLNLRATRASISRLYLGDIPVFEFVRGGSLDSTTQGGSIFNLANTKDVEVYPGNPPAYLAGSTGGALRALPPSAASAGGNLSVNSAAIGLTNSFVSPDGGSFATLSGLYSDFEPQLSVNPSLSDLVSRLHLRSAALVGRATVGPSSALSVFAQAESEEGRYPDTVLSSTEAFVQAARRLRLLASYAAGVGPAALTLNAAYTWTRTRQAFAGWSSVSSNRYFFTSLDLAADALDGKLTVRAGIDRDHVHQASAQAVAGSRIPIADNAPPRSRNRNGDVSGYAFASYRLGPAALVSLGGRHILSSSLGGGYALQASGTVSSADRRHKLIVSLGHYAGVEMPQFAYFGGLARSVSRQAEANYSFTVPRLRLGLSAYHSDETSDATRSALREGRFYVFGDSLTGIGRRTVTTGVEAYANASPIDRLETKLSFARVHQRLHLAGERVTGSNDFGYIARASARYQAGVWGLNLAATARDHAPFTRVRSIETGPDGEAVPLVDPVNAARLPRYFSLDASAARPIALSRNLRPLGFVSVSDLLDRRNAASQILTADGSTRYRRFAGRVVTFGLSLNF